MPAGHGLFRGGWAESFFASQIPEVDGIPWFVSTSLQPLLCSHTAFSSRCQNSLYLHLVKISEIAFRVHSDKSGKSPYLKILQHVQIIFFLIFFFLFFLSHKATFIGSRAQDHNLFLGGHYKIYHTSFEFCNLYLELLQ